MNNNILEILNYTNAEIEDNKFITKPGIKIIKASEMNEDFDIFLQNNLKFSNKNKFEKNAEFNSKLTYMQFDNNNPQYLDKMINEYGHLSIFTDTYVTFLIAGISAETVIELLAHTEQKSNRWTTSKTISQNETYYRIQGNKEQKEEQKNAINKFLELKKSIKLQTTEFNNMFNLGNKITCLTYCMNLKDLLRFINGRIIAIGNETEIQEIARIFLNLLYEKYSILFEKLYKKYN